MVKKSVQVCPGAEFRSMGMAVDWMQSHCVVTDRVDGGVAFLPPRESCLGCVDFTSQPVFRFALVPRSPGDSTAVYFHPQSVQLLVPPA